MPFFDLRDFVLTRSGHWTEESRLEKSYQPGFLVLRTIGDKVTLKGPLYARVTQNVEYPPAPGSTSEAPSILPRSSYVISIPPGQTWSYTYSEEDTTAVTEADKQLVAVAIEPLTPTEAPAYSAMPSYFMASCPGISSTAPTGVGGYFYPGLAPGISSCDVSAPIIVDPFFPPFYPGYGPDISPCAPSSPGLQAGTVSQGTAPQRPWPGAGYIPHFQPGSDTSDVPCDFAVSEIQNSGQFFPSACEQCPPGSTINIPPGKPPGIKVRVADGGCVRPRFFNGQFITKEDLDTLVRWSKLRMQLHNRAAGQGVVWGFDVFRDGRNIAVRPGYGVDCCGHDLTINKTYCVDINALLCDPAAAAILSQPGKQCLHLLLEYYECHEHPRPVHGDQCSNDKSLCDMSRTRETARLRLVPPRDYQPDGPIGAFLREVEALKKDPVFRLVLERAESDLAAASVLRASAAQPPTEVPYMIEIGLLQSNSQIKWVPFQPSLTEETSESNSKAQFISAGTPPKDNNIHIRLTAVEGQTFLSSGSVIGPDGGTLTPITDPTDQVVWVFTNTIIPELTGGTDNITLRQGTLAIADLRVAAPGSADIRIVSSPVITLSTVALRVIMTSGTNFQLQVTATVPPIDLTVEQPDQELPPLPCLNKTCGEGDEPLFPVTPPWIHEDPFRPGEPADPKVLILAIVHAWLMMEITRHQVGTANQTTTPQLQSAILIYRVLLNAFFGASDTVAANRLSELLHRLLCAWCKGFLYPGPRCLGEPHGVVIGSVTVEAGNIADINPWGGRRYVVHYPLLAHWGEQLGILPLDVMVSRVMSMICCVAGLPLPPDMGRGKPDDIKRPVFVGNALLSVAAADPPAAVGRVVRRESLSHAEFMALAARSLNSPQAAQPAAEYVRYELSGAPEVALLVPETVAALQLSAEVVAAERKSERIRQMAEPALKKVPPLMEDLVHELSTTMLDVTPVAIGEDSPVFDGLTRAGLMSSGHMLQFTPAELHKKVLKGADPKALTEVLKANDKLASDVTKVVAGAVGKFSEEMDVVSPEELSTEANLTAFTKALTTAIKRRRAINIPPELVEIITKNTVKRVAGREA